MSSTNAVKTIQVFDVAQNQLIESETVVLTDAEWRKRLSPMAFKVLRQHGTERAFSCGRLDDKTPGRYVCAGCGLDLFVVVKKFDSGTGWPSFNAPVHPNNIGTTTDYLIGYPRTEVHCARCGGHLGHVFDDGPPPTGLRYCMNSVSMTFIPDAE
jgi:peptide-methionine (R)-S-oxide reductase